jgi:N-acetyl-gamma-glutamyl-phosphate reductase
MGDATVGVAVLGASGSAGGELVRLLAVHPSFDICYLGAQRAAGETLAQVHPHLEALSLGTELLRDGDPAQVAAVAELVFTALPHGASAAVVPALRAAGCTVVDLAGDFRLAAEDYPAWYGFPHPAPDLLPDAVYGLPELLGERLPGAGLVANPGCYPTSVVLGCAPLLAAGLVEPGRICVDGKTGLSGAGREPTPSSMYVATEGSIRPYRLPRHQHTPEMERGLQLASGHTADVLFAPHLVPTVRGVVTTSYLTLAPGITSETLTACLAEAYRDRPFVRVLPAGEMVDAKRTRGSNVIELQAVADPRTGTAVVVGALDNLIKGAAGQAIQNANLALGLPETSGLPSLGVYP